jgi:hypothetical protein
LRGGVPEYGASDEMELGPFTPCELRQGLPLDDRLEMLGLLMFGESRFIGEDLVEEEFSRFGGVLVNLELPHTRFLLRLRKKAPEQARNRRFLAGVGLPECGYDEFLVRAVGHGRLLLLFVLLVAER